MGYYTEYLNKNLDFNGLSSERKNQLRQISALREGRDVLVIAADLNKQIPLISIGYSDLLPIKDQISELRGDKIDIILETPGGSGETAEDIVKLVRERYTEVGIIIPGYAKSAGTIMAMSGDEILMSSSSISSLGPIDAQLFWQGKIFSAGAFLEGLKKIQKEVEETGTLNKTYIPILQGISPGEIQNAQNALDFARILVKEWLTRYKFKSWQTHLKNKQAVTQEEKEFCANEIAGKLCDHQHWLTHARSIRLKDLEDMGLRITDYSKIDKLAEAIDRYYTLLQMSFSSPLYKLFETPTTQIQKFLAPIVTAPQQDKPSDQNANIATVDLTCNNCKTKYKIQINLDKPAPLEPGAVAFPADNKLKCAVCGIEHDLSKLKEQIESQTHKKVIV